MLEMEKIKESIKAHHDTITPHGMRWGSVHEDGTLAQTGGACFFSFTETVPSAIKHKRPYVYSIFHGDGAPLSFEALYDGKKFNSEMAEFAQKQPWNKFVGTTRTRRWIKFLLSDQSPWRALVPYIAEPSLTFINDGGFIFKDLEKIPSRLLYNFVMAYRMPWEMPRPFTLWTELTKIVQPALALYIALNFSLSKDNVDGLEGPYDLQYPWSPLEETCYESVGRFVLGRPKQLTPSTSLTSPNVKALWPMDDQESIKGADTLFAEFEASTNLRLTTIVNGLTRLIIEQEKAMEPV